MTPVAFTAPAVAELDEAEAYYHRAQRADLGAQFRDEVRRTVESVGRMPRLYPLLDDPFRRARTRRFPYGLVDTIEQDSIVIHAVMHLHRKPGYWRDRLK